MNGHLVLRFGMEKMVTTALYGFLVIALGYVIIYANDKNPGIWT